MSSKPTLVVRFRVSDRRAFAANAYDVADHIGRQFADIDVIDSAWSKDEDDWRSSGSAWCDTVLTDAEKESVQQAAVFVLHEQSVPAVLVADVLDIIAKTTTPARRFG
jgi:hypothetical protein